jgi:hypothetical protein
MEAAKDIVFRPVKTDKSYVLTSSVKLYGVSSIPKKRADLSMHKKIPVKKTTIRKIRKTIKTGKRINRRRLRS